jgi:UDP-N-acetylmuramoyl-L-alanyl-D-glutamate--2,6-diaminopimelate ligase
MKNSIKKIIPKSILLFYHKILALSAAFFYGFPSREMVTIGVTGTTGKTSTCNMIAKILEEAGFKIGMTSTVNFKIGDREWINKTKQTMQGRFKLQKLLQRMVREKCDYAIIETSSEGIAQFRHLGIDYDVAVFTNLSPEHIESHGSFEKYRQAKEKLFQSLKQKNKKTLRPRSGQAKEQKKVKKVSIVNLDDANVEHFLKYDADEKYGYQIPNPKSQFPIKSQILNPKFIIKAENVHATSGGVNFIINRVEFHLRLLGEFNVYNALAAICVGLSQNIGLETAKAALKKISVMPGRMELIDEGQPFKVIVDYAHEPKGLEKVYKTIRDQFVDIREGSERPKIISVLGACGGGRDKGKRPILGKLAAKYTDYVIVTNEDPYDEEPMKIIDEVFNGVVKISNNQETITKQIPNPQFPIPNQIPNPKPVVSKVEPSQIPNIQNTKYQIPDTKTEGINAWRILDRREAIKKALKIAGPNDVVIITGKGSEQCIVGKNNQKIPWDERGEVRALLKERVKKPSENKSN